MGPPCGSCVHGKSKSEEQTSQEKKENIAGRVQSQSQRSHKGTAIISDWSRQSPASSDLRGGDMEPTIGVSMNLGPYPKTTKDNKKHPDLNCV